jgi:hypothetical protein
MTVMTDSERIARLERICHAQQTFIDHHVTVLNRLLKATGQAVGTHMISDADMHAICEAHSL